MFDGLKEKLGRFRDDVEEEAEEADDEAPEPTGADGTAEPAEPADHDEPLGEAEPSAEPAQSPTPDSPPEPAGSGEPLEPEAPVETSDEPDVESTGDERASDSGGGFMHRAKSLATGQIVVDPEVIEGPLDDLEFALLESDVEFTVAQEIVANLRDELENATRGMTQTVEERVDQALREALLEVISVGQFDFDERIAAAEKPVTLIFTGVNGVGKTTSIAKLSQYLEERGYSTVLANGDTYRAGANEQIREHARNLDTKLISHEQGGDPAAVIYDAVEYAQAHGIDVVLGDTAGRLHTNEGLMDQLEKIDRVVGPDMTLFTDEAVAGQDAVQRAKKFNDAAEIDGAILTKADADANGGAAISIAYVTGKPILFLGTGQGYDDIERFDPDWLVDQLLGA
ncbi:signal recognition particle-docking protein FtsY [Halalkalicoccus jeotgali]|uniref:Signal recognition particle receptor FtsY n=1 Tax=Halalkalicoccus jeotgali (strain DSM 18796 / CECT 7217 / JCM 14584 / KCTC 4019 / B3) TaxID=795797 RepID=D8J597_HALJB|nr:signal recognition particle-docking protein FtsY [Halalkalicoccus jeotgali]ADJ13678.1 signal recognition particle-docking protein FtsY [Halalkalicoccus jeotgali B3]ELY34275.1 cell division protein FtsY [Halalkalicoccus jeotgali B3]